MDYEKVIKFAFAWLFNRESWKYVLLVWAVSIVFFLLIAGVFLLLFSSLISAFLADPTGFVLDNIANPVVFFGQILGLLLLFLLVFIVLSVINFFINLYISALIYFYSFRTARLSYAPFPLPRLFWLFILNIAEGFFVCTSWFHRKVWILFLIAIIGVLSLPLIIISPFMAVVPIALFGIVLLALLVVPLYLFVKQDYGPEVVITHRYLLLVCPVLIALALPLFLLSLTSPIIAIFSAIFVVLLFLGYMVVIVYNSIRLAAVVPAFLSKGKGIMDSFRDSLSLTENRVGETFIAFLAGGVIGVIFFLIIGLVVSAILMLLFLAIIPDDLFGLAGFLNMAEVAESSAFLTNAKVQVAQEIASQAWQYIVAPLSMLYYTFLSVAVYMQLLSKPAPKKKASAPAIAPSKATGPKKQPLY